MHQRSLPAKAGNAADAGRCPQYEKILINITDRDNNIGFLSRKTRKNKKAKLPNNYI